MNCSDKLVMTEYHNQLHLKSLWVCGLQFASNEFEMFAAGARIGVDIRKLYFILPDPSEIERFPDEYNYLLLVNNSTVRKLDSWKKFISNEICPYATSPYSTILTTVAGNKTVNVHDIAINVLKIAQKFISYKKYIFKLVTAITVILVWLPLMMDMSDYTDPWKVVFVLSSNYILAVMFVVDIHFLVAAIMDASRRYHVAQILSRMARPSHLDVAPVLNFRMKNPMVGLGSNRSLSSVSTRSNSIMSSVSISSGSRSGNYASTAISKVPPTPATSNHSSPRDGNRVGSGNGSATSIAVVPLDEVDIEQQADTFMNASMETTKDNKTNNKSNIIVDSNNVSSTDVFHSAVPGSESEAPKDYNLGNVPRVDFQVHQNLYAWLYTRTVLLDYGHRMQVQVNVYVG